MQCASLIPRPSFLTEGLGTRLAVCLHSAIVVEKHTYSFDYNESSGFCCCGNKSPSNTTVYQIVGKFSEVSNLGICSVEKITSLNSTNINPMTPAGYPSTECITITQSASTSKRYLYTAQRMRYWGSLSLAKKEI